MAGQYSRARIVGIWALAAIPMGILSWIVFPAVSPNSGSDPLGIVIHSAQSVFFAFLILGVVLGLA